MNGIVQAWAMLKIKFKLTNNRIENWPIFNLRFFKFANFNEIKLKKFNVKKSGIN